MEEQQPLIQALPDYLAAMALFSINTGCRRGEVMAMRWSWQINGLPVFRIPPEFHKSGGLTGHRFVVCNTVAWSIVNEQRGKNSEFMFTRSGKPVKTFHGRAWRKAREKVGLSDLRVHDLRCTFATRLAACGVIESDIGLLLGHASGRVTSRYIKPDLERLLSEAEKIVAMDGEPVLRLVG